MKKTIRTLLAVATTLCMAFSSALAQSYADHTLTQSMNDGSCRKLVGKVEMVVLSVNAKGAEWNEEDQRVLEKEVALAAEGLEKEAASYGVELSIATVFHHAYADIPEDVDSDWVEDLLEDTDGLSKRRESDWKNAPLILCFNTAGRARAQQRYGSGIEYLMIYEQEAASVIQHEVLHLFGAEDLYVHSDIEKLADQLYPESVMLGAVENGVVDSLTAYLLGWMPEPDEKARQLLDATQHLTLDDLYAALDDEMISGEGVFPQDDGVYYGQMKDGCFHGQGCMRWNDGSLYTGSWDWGVRHGSGTYIWASGTSYTGSFVKGEQTGYGCLRWAGGDMYAGDFVNGKRQGTGVMRWNSGEVYIGDFASDMFHGEGTFIWTDGAVYTGSYANNERNGYGVMTLANGDCYEGQFKDGLYHGEGTLRYADGTVQSGEWENGNLVRQK